MGSSASRGPASSGNAPSAQGEERVCAEGWLWKTGSWRVSAWSRAYCVLLDSPPRIEYYPSHKQYEESGKRKVMSFDGARIDDTAVACAPTGSARRRGLHCLEIYTPHRTWRFGAEDEASLSAWLRAINFTISAHPYRESTALDPEAVRAAEEREAAAEQQQQQQQAVPRRLSHAGGVGGKQAEVDVTLKIVSVGDIGAGKTRLLMRYADGRWIDPSWSGESAPLFDFRTRVVKCADKLCRLNLWDTQEQERFLTVSLSLYRGADAVLVVYDITNVQSFENAAHWILEVRRFTREGIPVMLLGNKLDLNARRAVNCEAARKWATSQGLLHAEVSACTYHNVDEAFLLLVRSAIRNSAFPSPRDLPPKPAYKQ